MTGDREERVLKRKSSPAGRGGAGVYIEGELGAFYLLTMLAASEPRGLPGATLRRVRFQGVDLGYALDDLILHAVGASGDLLLEIQSKRTIAFSRNDKTFKEIAEQIASSLQTDLPEERHQFAVATQRTSKAIAGPYQDVLQWTRTTGSSAEFLNRLASRGVASAPMREFVATFRANLVAAGVDDVDDRIWRILRRFSILEFDFESAAPLARTHALALARQVLADEDSSRAQSLWSNLIEISIATAKTSGSLDRDELRAKLVDRGFRLTSDRNYRPARASLAEMARNKLEGIGTTVADVHLPRLDAVAALDKASDEHRFIWVCGGPGVGKSALLRHVAERAARQSQIIVLDPVNTPSGGLLELVRALGIPGTAHDFLSDLAVSGGSVIFIDGLEMFTDLGRQRTVGELLRVASAIAGFSVIATTRAGYGGEGDAWLEENIIDAFGGVHAVEVGELTNADVEELVSRAPELRAILASTHPATRIARNLYRLSRLLKVSTSANIRTEAALASHWWSRADGAPKDDVRPAQRILADLAGRALDAEEELELPSDSNARSHLLGSLTLKEVRRDHLSFYHDVLRDWALGSFVDEDPGRLAGKNLSLPVLPPIARGVEIAGRLALETRQDCVAWLGLLTHLSPTGAHSSWRRQGLLAILRSEIASELLERCSAALLAHGGALFIELCTAVVAVETVPAADLLKVMNSGAATPIPRSLRINTTGSAVWLLFWVLAHAREIPLQAIDAVVALVEIQIQLIVTTPRISGPTAAMLFGWLRQLDVRNAEVTIPSDPATGRFDSEARRRTVEHLRTIALLLSSHAPDAAKAYLGEVATGRDSYKVKAIRPLSATLAAVAPAELCDLISASLLRKPERGSRYRTSSTRAFSFADSDYLPASPAQPPFIDLLQASPEHGLALVQKLLRHAVEHGAVRPDPGADGYTLVFDNASRFFPWTQTYFWSRDQAREYSAASGLKALEAWGHGRLDAGEPIEALLPDILGPEGSCAAYLLVAVDLLISHYPATRVALVPFLACPELLAVDRLRSVHDQMDLGSRHMTGDEPTGRATLADLRARPSRRTSLEQLLPAYLTDEPVSNRLRVGLRTAVETLESYKGHASFGDPSFMGAYASNVLNPTNWERVEGGRAYRSPPDEAAHLKRLGARHDRMIRFSEMEARIDLAIDNPEHATPETARDAVDYASGDLPDDSGIDANRARSTRLIATAILVARDGNDDLLDAHETWVREVIDCGLSEEVNRFSGRSDMLRFNPPALATLALLHLWLRRQAGADRDALVAIAARRDRCATPAFAAALDRIVETDPRLIKAATRAAFGNCRWRWHSWDEDEADQKHFESDLATATEKAVAAEITWLEGGDEPAWPAFPNETPTLRRSLGMRVPVSADLQEELEDPESVNATRATVHFDYQAAASWLRLLSRSSTVASFWGGEIVEAYSFWTAQVNGLGLPAYAEVDSEPSDWNHQFYILFAAALMDAPSDSFDAKVQLVTGLPDQPFGDVAETLIHAADVRYFNVQDRPAARLVELRARLVSRTLALKGWASVDASDDLSIDHTTGGVVAKLFLNTYNPFEGVRSYLVPAVYDRLDPLLEPLQRLLTSGPTPFVALCTMNMLLVAPRPRHLAFLLAGVEAWLDRRSGDYGFWIDMGVGQKVVDWLETAIQADPRLLDKDHPQRTRIDRMLGQLVSIGVAPAHELEKQVERVFPISARVIT